MEKTKIGYKLFEEDNAGRLYPLFIGKNKETEVGKWLHAEYIPTKGFATRGGWHIGDMPDAPWLKSADGTYKPRWKNGRRVWCEVEYNATIDYDSIVENLPKKCIENGIPENGFYFFREAGKGVWSITSDIKILRKLSEDERQSILRSFGHDEDLAFKPYKEAMEKRMNRKGE